MYEQVYEICQNIEQVMGMFSKELYELDSNFLSGAAFPERGGMFICAISTAIWYRALTVASLRYEERNRKGADSEYLYEN